MRTLRVIGIGAGDPEHLTVQAINALNAVEVFFVLDKGETTADLTEARRDILRRYAERPHRVVELTDPPRDRGAEDYSGAVRDWRDERARLLERAIEAELGPDGRGGILVWGDPALYDGTIRTVESILAAGRLELTYQVIPGISSVQALAARHRIALNRVGGAVHVTTGRRLAEGVPAGVDDVVVMLDAGLRCGDLRGHGFDIYWGAYLGTPDEAVVAGPLDEVFDEVRRTRDELRRRKGWIMDTYLLRRRRPG
ncbi:MAG TPA: precorrin-6A synthase (deacetylating) [Pseudonocardia sp.]